MKIILDNIVTMTIMICMDTTHTTNKEEIEMDTKLKNSVVRRVGGWKKLEDVYNHGAAAGFPGFIYYTDTTKFFRTHKAAIVKMAEEMAQDIGEDVLTMVAGFRCLNKGYTPSEIGKVLYGNWKEDDTHTIIGNAMAWFVLEEVARDIFDR